MQFRGCGVTLKSSANPIPSGPPIDVRLILSRLSAVIDVYIVSRWAFADALSSGGAYGLTCQTFKL